MKRFASIALAGTLAVSMAAPALAATPALISAKLPTITLNGVALDTSKLPQAEGIPLRAFVEADGGAATWYPEENCSNFYTEDGSIMVKFADGSIQVGDETFTGAVAVEGVTFVPAEAVDALSGVTVTKTGNDYAINTSSADPIVQLAKSIREDVGLSAGMKNTAAQMEEYYGLEADNFESVVAYMPMMISADTVVLGKVADGKLADAKEGLKSIQDQTIQNFENYLPGPLEVAKNGQIVTNGDYVMLIMSSDNVKAIERFNAGVKGL